MFIRSELKTQAKESLHRNLWITIGVCFVATFLSNSANFVGTSADELGRTSFHIGLGSMNGVSLNLVDIEIPLAAVSFIGILTLIYKILIANPIIVGQSRYFLENRQEPSKFEVLFDMFRKETYWNVVKIMVLRDIYQILWTMLFIFPGIYKAFEYSMIPYILAENPTMDSADVFALTKILTKNVKLDLFILLLSFLPWYLLSVFTCGIAFFYVNAYVGATETEAYIFLRDSAIEKGIIEPDNETKDENIEVEYVEPTIEDLH